MSLSRSSDKPYTCRKWQQRVAKEMNGSAAMKAKLKRYGDLDEPFLRWAV